jgi:hypothetical protein
MAVVDLASAASVYEEALPTIGDPEADEGFPDIIEFVTSPRFLNQRIYPRQATLLKIIFLQDWLFSSYDYDVIDQWASGFALPPPERRKPGDPLYYEGYEGVQPDVLDRIDQMKREERRWFREVINVAGRRGSKGYIGALCGAYIIYCFWSLHNPQEKFNVARAKKLTAFVFAAKREQAKVNQWQDIADVVQDSPFFARWVPKGGVRAESLHLQVPEDRNRQRRRAAMGIDGGDLASIVVVPKESTKTAGRGPASFLQYYDEMAWIVREYSSADAGEVYDSATPSLDQFRGWEFIYCGSSPWQMLGRFYELYLEGLQIDPHSGEPMRPERLVLQLPSWGLYEDWDRAHLLPRVGFQTRKKFHCIEFNDGRTGYHPFPTMGNPPQLYDEQMRREERSNPETFKVERLARWATALDAYLNPDQVREAFGRWGDREIVQEERGIHNREYVAHGDPSSSGANFGYAIGHAEGPDERGLRHVVFDQIGAWKPQDFPDHRIDYVYIKDQWVEKIKAFVPTSVSFDQFSSAPIIAFLRQDVEAANLWRRVEIFEKTATKAENWKVAETFKTALNLGLVHAPYDELAYHELIFLQDMGNHSVDKPSSGPVQTKDIYDCLSIVTYLLIGDELSAYIGSALGEPPSFAAPGGLPKHTNFTGQDRDEVIESLRGFGKPTPRGRGGVSPERGGHWPTRQQKDGRRGWGSNWS